MGRRERTATSSFGVGARQGHDPSVFYGRFAAPQLCADDTVRPPEPAPEPFLCADARHMDEIRDGSVALVVTSPPYFAGKDYELGDDAPDTYESYLGMLTEVLAECSTKLEPGGRMAVNVANLGRRPYRSLSGSLMRIMEHDLGLWLRGEIIWRKAPGASGSCAWGTFRSPVNPVLRDTTERIVVASKGRFDRALKPADREAAGLPHIATIDAGEFMAATLDVWDIAPASARKVGHPAPFPVELPARLICLYSFVGDLILDPFMGSGTTLVAAARLARRYAGYDTDPRYVDLARHRVATEGSPGSGPGEPSR